MTWVLALLPFLLTAPAHADDGFLDPSVAFAFQAHEVPGAVALQYRVAEGYYMYRERFAFSSADAGVRLGTPRLPAGQVKFDETFGKEVETYRHEVGITVPVDHADGPFDLVVISQGCSDKGVCYPPITHRVHVAGAALSAAPSTNAMSAASATSATDGATPRAPSLAGAPAPETGGAGPAVDALPATASGLDRFYSQDYATSVLNGRSLPAILGIFFVLGLALSLLPCSLPMIPILSSIILGEGAALTRRRGFVLSLSYVLGMAIVYTVFGVAAALAGQSLGAMLQNPWILGGFGALLIAFALSQMGCYEVQLPAAWQNRVSGVAQRLSGGKLLAVFLMGAVSALIVGACMTAPLFGVMAFIAQTGDVLIGAVSLFVMALGIGVPLLIVGVGAGTLLPRAGAWMESVKRAFGVVLFGAAVWIVTPILPASLGLLAWALVAALLAFELGTFAPLAGASGPRVAAWRPLGRALGMVVLAFALALVLGAAAGARDPLRPLAVFSGARAGGGQEGANTVGDGTGTAGTRAVGTDTLFAPVRTLAELDAATANAASAGQPSMLFFHADWCTSCVEMERFVFPDPKVRALLGRFARLEADVTHNRADDKALMQRFNLFGPPAVIFFDAQGREITRLRMVGYQPAERFAATLSHALEAAGAVVPGA
ncbi:MAG: protein-disulfide reductase DsbD [Janthinobacterium lividum]